MEGFSLMTTCGQISYAPRIAILIGMIAVLWSLLDSRREIQKGAGYTQFDVWVRRAYFVLFVGFAAASCIFVSSSITGFASTAAVADGSRIAGVTAIGSLLIVVFLIVQALRARSKRGKIAPSGAVEDMLFMKMMALHLAALIPLAYVVCDKILEYQTIALTGVP